MIHRSLLLATLLVLAAGCSSSSNEEKSGSPVQVGADARRFHFTYTTRVPAPPPGTGRLDVWVPLPMEDPGVQHVSNLETRTGGHPGTVTTESRYGNRMLHVSVENPTEPTEISWSAVITRSVDTGQGALPDNPRYLDSNRLIPLDGKAAEQARKLGASDPSVPLPSRAQLIYDDVLEAMAYDKGTPGYGYGDFERSMTVCKGNCTDFHARFIGTGRAAGIPCRFTMGIPMKDTPEGTYNSYHCWAHWYDGSRWHPVDISEADKVVGTDPEKARWFFGHLGASRVALTFGRDIVLEPPQSSEPLNYFVFPYAEADKEPVELDKSMWTFRWRDV